MPMHLASSRSPTPSFIRASFIPAAPNGHTHAVVNAHGITYGQPAILRLIAENAAEEAQIQAEYTRLQNAGAKVSWYGKEAYGGSDHMALGLEVELA